ncbi:MAG: lipase maturation factor family protein [Myxococcota bacterium]
MPGESEAGHRDLERVAALFARGLGAVYACAFASLWVQIDGLIGARGVTPAADLVALARDQLGAAAPLQLPTLFLATGASDWSLHADCALGLAAGIALALGRAQRSAAFAAWIAYLSLCAVGNVFLSFQWDALLLEAGFAALFALSAEPRLGVWLARALLFKLMFSSGAVKLLSGDSTWRDGSALAYHYWTQPLPLVTSVFAADLPPALQRASTFLTLAVELGAPWAMLGPRRVRLAGAAVLAALQLAIAATGNYGFFNLLTLVLCACLLDDAALARYAWLRLASRSARWHAPLRAAALVLAAASLVSALTRLTPRDLPAPLVSLVVPFEELRLVSSYGLFAVMTTARPEIEVEGSADGVEWRTYDFRWKAGALDRPPRFAGPHMPRLDWQMWFAALGHCEREVWFQRLLQRLLEGSPPVTRLLASDPFPDGPPRYLRTTLWQYRFASGEERRAGAWWTRTPDGAYCPTVTLRAGRLALADDLAQ